MLKRRLYRLFESAHVKMPHCWKSHVAAHFANLYAYCRCDMGFFWQYLKDSHMCLMQTKSLQINEPGLKPLSG